MGSHINEEDLRPVLDPLRVVVRALRLSGREGVSGAQLFVLESLRDLRVASINELAAATHTHQSSVSVVVTRLARAGFVARHPSKTDARRIEVQLTPAGRKTLARAAETPQTRLVRALAAMSPKRRQVLAELLGELADATGLSGPPPMFLEEETS